MWINGNYKMGKIVYNYNNQKFVKHLLYIH